MMPVFVSRACSMNNQGVAFLVAGETTRAIGYFHQALSFCKDAVNLCDEVEDMWEAKASQAQRLPIKLPLRECSASIPSVSQSNSSGYLYNRALLLANVCEEYDDNVLAETLPLYSAMLLFNLALACHQQAIKLGKESSSKKPVALYSCSLQLIDNFATKATPYQTEEPEVMVLRLAALNNRALAAYHQSYECHHEISTLLANVRASGARLQHFCLDAQDVEGLLLNIMLLHPPEVAQAA